MRGKWSRRSIDRLENLLIALLACSALVLIVQSGLGQAAGRGTGSGGETVFTGVQGTAPLPGHPGADDGPDRARPVRGCSMTRTRWTPSTPGGSASCSPRRWRPWTPPHPATREDWQEAITQSSRWVYCDFLYNISFVAQGSGGGGGRPGLPPLRPRGKGGDGLLLQPGDGGVLRRPGGRRRPHLPQHPGGPGGTTAPASPLRTPRWWRPSPRTPWCSPRPPSPRCTPWPTPWPPGGEAERTALLEALDFNLRAIALYETTEGTVLQEGSDTLRLQKDGQVLYHAARPGPGRFQALSSRRRTCS